jgi:hypothetical protein
MLGFDFEWIGLPERLVEAGVWEDRKDGGYWLHDYLEYNPSKEEVLSRRKKAVKRTQRWRKRYASVDASVTPMKQNGDETLRAVIPAPPLSVDLYQFVRTLKDNTAYKGIDIDREMGKLDAWLLTRPREKKTKRRIVNWLNTAVDRAGFATLGSGSKRSDDYFGVRDTSVSK